ncbi:MAG: hypothetical protein PHQ61_08425 [Candidatus Omnitrophica bacterium]|nr:hypothetical protein [Candidatus Omnitrophota bacterium]
MRHPKNRMCPYFYYGKFNYASLKHGEKYYGEALISCYKLEKNVNCIGIFITDRAMEHQSIFPMEPFSKDLHFVYFQQYYYRFFQEFHGFDALSWNLIDQLDYVYPIIREMIIFRILCNNARKQIEPDIRAKYLQYLEYYRKKYPWPLNIWEDEGFGMKKVVPSVKWMSIYRNILREDA